MLGDLQDQSPPPDFFLIAQRFFLNNVHSRDTNVNIVQFNPETFQMQSLVVQLATTLIGDTVAMVNGFGRIVTHFAMAPVERIARACDVAGLLSERAARAAERERIRQAWPAISQRPGRRSRGHGLFGCLRSLGELT